MKARLPILVKITIAILFLLPLGSVRAGEEPATGFVGDYLMQLDAVQKQILSLENAMPQEKFTWRPSEGVRSVSEVYLHIAFANYLLTKFAGYDPPADVASQVDLNYLSKWDASTTDKTAIAERVTKSFDHLRSTVAKISDTDLESKVEFFGQMLTKRNMMLTALSHLHEHLGQSIAYARMNGVVPPWSAGEQQQGGN